MKEMDHIKKRKISSEFLASVIPQLLLSVSIFSFVFSYSSSLSSTSSSSSSSSSSLVYSPMFHYFSSNYFHLLSHALNKNCLFLICNGLLVFVAKTSGFVRPPSAYELNEMLQKRIGGDGDLHHQTALEAKLEPLLEKFVLSQEITSADAETKLEEVEAKKLANDECLKSESRNEVSIFIAESEEEDVEQKSVPADTSRKCWLFDDDDDQEEQLYGEQVDLLEEAENDDEELKDEEKEEVSTEELNQKFEDFIRRMKKEIIISEARHKAGQKLVMLN